MIARVLRRLRRDRRGVTVVEFAIVAPVMLLLIMGLAEFAYQSYIQVILSGAMQKAGRDSTIQGNDARTDAIDRTVMGSVWTVVHNATYESSRKSYAQFGSVAPEYFFDDNSNGVFDAATECFTDINGNRNWDRDPGVTGQGGAGDVTVYKMTVTYRRLFPLAGLMGLAPINTIAATTILKNQPYSSQVRYTPTKVCP